MNIVLVIFDTLRKDCVGTYGSPPWWEVHTPNFDAFARESIVMDRAFPESLPTLPARRAIYTGQRVYPFHDGDFRLKGDFIGAPGWGPIPEDQPTMAELLGESGYRTGLVSDVFHMFKPSKNFWRGFDQWTFLRGQETDPSRSGPELTPEQLDYWLPAEMQETRPGRPGAPSPTEFVQQCIMNIHDRNSEADYFAPKVMKEASLWLEQNRDAERSFLTVECFDPHEPWLVPAHYRRMYSDIKSRELAMVPVKHRKKLIDSYDRELAKSTYGDTSGIDGSLLSRIHANYCGLVTCCDRWFGYLMESMRVLDMLGDTMVILTSDHGHSIGDGGYMGKRGYPSAREVFDVPLIVRMPGARHAGKRSNMFVQHTDITAEILSRVNVDHINKIEGRPFIDDAVNGNAGHRDHATVGWGSTPTVITDRWWFNCKVDGTGALLYDLGAENSFAKSVTGEYPEVVSELFTQAKYDAGGSFPEWLVELARNEEDAPGCSAIAARG